MDTNKFARTAFKWQTQKEASYNLTFWENQSYEKRLASANYLNSVAYNYDLNNPPKMDKTIFKIRKRK